ncbi:MAG: hypothetical protein ABIR18_06020 [Chitinophagaceae bacterium]
MKWLISLLCILICSEISFAQVLRKPLAAAYMGFGVYSCKQADVFSFPGNQAALAQLKNTTVGIYAEQRFLISELSYYTMAAALVTRSGHFGLRLGYSGFSGYNESQAGFAYARKLGSKVDVGVQFNYNGINVAGYGNASAISFEIGSIFHLTEELHAGIHANNPVGGKFGKEKQEKLPACYTVGLGYDASKQFFISMEIVKEELQPITVNAGMQYLIDPQVLVRAGLLSATSSLWLGIGVLWKSIRVDVAASYHSQLGISPGFLLLYNPIKKED